MDTGAAPPRRRWRRPVLAAAFAAFVGVWAWAFWYDATRPNPEPLDAASQHAAAAACGSAIASLSALTPLPPGVPTLGERTRRVLREDTVLTDLVTRLDRIHPADREGAKALVSFALDWQHLTASREHYVEALSSGEKNPKLVIPVAPNGAPVTIRMREYAEIHRLLGCTPDSLQGEVVEGPRTYQRVP